MKHVQDMHPSIVRAIAEVQASVASVKRDGRNSHGGYDFASTDAIYAALSVKMGQTGLTILTLEDEPEIKTVHTLVKENRKVLTDKDGNPITEPKQWAKFRFQFVLATDEGTWTDERCSRSLFIQVMGAQTFMAAQSYCEKTFLRSLFKLPTGDLDLDALPTEETPRKASSNGAKKDQIWEKFTGELDSATDLATVIEIEQRYTSKMPNANWKEQMYESLERKRTVLLSEFNA